MARGGMGSGSSLHGRRASKVEKGLRVACPDCGAPISVHCIGKGSKRIHDGRWRAFGKLCGQRRAARERKQAEMKRRFPVEQPSVLKGVT